MKHSFFSINVLVIKDQKGNTLSTTGVQDSTSQVNLGFGNVDGSQSYILQGEVKDVIDMALDAGLVAYVGPFTVNINE